MPAVAGIVALALVASACAATPSKAGCIDCETAPGRAVTVFLEGGAPDAPRQTFAKVTFGQPEPGMAGTPVATLRRYTFTDASGATHRLGYLDPSGRLPAGGRYDLVIETVMGEPSPGAIVVSDERGLLMAAASDTGLGRNVLRDGLPGFAMRLVDGGCRSRKVTQCFASRVNAILEVTHDGATVRLGHGQSARLGDYEVTCHAAETVKYTSACADAGVLTVSWSIRLVEP